MNSKALNYNDSGLFFNFLQRHLISYNKAFTVHTGVHSYNNHTGCTEIYNEKNRGKDW